MTDPIVVVGGGPAAASAVQTLRNEGHDGPVVVIGQEPHRPYERPPLSKEYLRGEVDRATLPVLPEGWYAEHDVELRLGTRVERIDPGARRVEIAGDDTLAYGSLLLAMGGRPKILGAGPSERIHYLRTVEDADRIAARLRPGARLVVVGAGFIGAEVAASARTRGAEVTVVDIVDVPLQRVVGPDIGGVLADIHRERGVELRMGEPVEGIEETSDGVVVTTGSGARLEGEAAVVGVAITPNVELAQEAGLAVENGILVDPWCRASGEDVFAAGDVANHDHPVFGRRIRVEHFDNALKMGAAAARSILGTGSPFDDPHWFWSDQYDVNLQYGGFAAEWDEIVVRGSIEDRDFSAFYLKGGVLLAALGMNRGREVRRAMKLIAVRARPDPDALRDEETDLRTLGAS